MSAQGEAFIAAAREAGADVDTSTADHLMGRLAKTPPEPKPAPASTKKGESNI